MTSLVSLLVLPVSLLAQTAPAGSKPATPAPAQGAKPAAAGERTINLTAKDDMKFDVTALTAKPGEKLKVVLKNVGTMPKMAMAHNFVLLKLTAKPVDFANASAMAGPTYIPANMKDQIIAQTAMTGPGESMEVSFDAPKAPGVYTFLCSFAGHFAAGMKGTLTVK